MIAAPARRLAVGLSIALAWSSPAAADDAPPAEEPPPPPLTTEVWREPDPPLDLYWHLLALPEYAVELAFTPVAVLVGLVEEYRLDQRIYDLLRNDEGTIQFIPGIDAGFGDGIGFGGELSLAIFGEDRELDVGAQLEGNRDYELTLEWEDRFPSLEGRQLLVEVLYARDSNVPYYGIGNDTAEDRRVLQTDHADAAVSFDLTPLGQMDIVGLATVGWHRDELSGGTDAPHPPVTDDPTMMDGVAPPPGFGQRLDFPYVRASVIFDSRDNVGTPTVGTYAALSAGYTRSLDPAPHLSAVSLTGSYTHFVPLLPIKRVLVLHGGAAAAIPTGGDDEVPFHELVVLGRKEHLRGYGKTRFRDELGWWATAEYRWLIWEYGDTRVGMSPTLWVDVGRVGDEVSELVKGPVHYSYGVGLRVAHETVLALELNLGFSPEGTEIGFSVGTEL